MHFSDTSNDKLLRAGHTRAHYAFACARKKRRKKAKKGQLNAADRKFCSPPQIKGEKYEDFLKIFVIL